jgi:hypothetical protein
MPACLIRGNDPAGALRHVVQCILCAVVVAGIPAVRAAQGTIEPVESITSKRIYGVRAWRDSVWLITPNGVNIGWDSTTGGADGSDASEVTWWGYETGEAVWYDAYTVHTRGAGLLVAGWRPASQARTNPVWVYPRGGATYTLVDLPWNTAVFEDTTRYTTMPEDAYGFWTLDAAYADGAVWMACGYGGLVRVTAADLQASGQDSLVAMQVYLPMPQDTTAPVASRSFRAGASQLFPPATMADTGFQAFLDSNFYIDNVTADTGAGLPALVCATTNTIWRFSLQDSTWEDLTADAARADGFTSFRRVYTATNTSASTMAVSVARRTAAGDTNSIVYTRDTATGRWHTMKEFTSVEAMSFGWAYHDGDTVAAAYVVHDGNKLGAYAPYTGEVLMSPAIYGAERSLNASIIYDVVFVPSATGADGYLWIATDNGLFYSRHEVRDQQEKNALLLAAKPPRVEAGLTETYAYPTIINQENDKTCFAYNLSEAAKVTIEVFDWNMDLVWRVTTEERPPGSRSRSGRSADALQDCWDGTDSFGNPVAPGVYYYKIISHAGGRSFGKIVVAR